jgi:dihydrofolate reductase
MIRQIVAIDSKRGIAKDGVQPWKLPGDEAYFGKLTKGYGGLVLMGSKTFEVIGHPLPDRENFVVSRDGGEIPGVTVVSDLEQFLAGFKEAQKDIWIIGGAKIYELTLSLTDELYVTEIEADFDCNQFYPDFLQAGFTAAETGEKQVENDVSFRFCVYKKA